MNKPITTKVHGMLDYSIGLLLLFAPNLFGFADMGGAAVWVPRLVGIATILQSLFTRYELGAVKALPMRMHLVNDYIAGALLVASPWLFRFHEAEQRFWLPHVVLGLGILLVTALTRKVPRHVELQDLHPGHA